LDWGGIERNGEEGKSQKKFLKSSRWGGGLGYALVRAEESGKTKNCCKCRRFTARGLTEDQRNILTALKVPKKDGGLGKKGKTYVKFKCPQINRS